MPSEQAFKVGDRCKLPGGSDASILGIHEDVAWVRFKTGYACYTVDSLTPIPPAPVWPEKVHLTLTCFGYMHAFATVPTKDTSYEVARRTVTLPPPGCADMAELIEAEHHIYPWKAGEGVYRVANTDFDAFPTLADAWLAASAALRKERGA